MAGVASVTATGVGAGLVSDLPSPIGIVVVSRGESAVGVHHLADAAKVVPVVVMAGPNAAILALFALAEVAAVDVDDRSASGVAAEELDALVEVVVAGGLRGAAFLDLLAALAEGVVAVFRALHGTAAPGDFHEPGLAVPSVAADAVAEQVSVRVVGWSCCRGGGEVEAVGVVGNIVRAVLGLDVERVRPGGEFLVGLEAIATQHPCVLPNAGDAGLHLHRRRLVGLAPDDDLPYPCRAADAGELVEVVVAVGGHGRAGPGGLYLLGGDVASQIVEVVVAGIRDGRAGKGRVGQGAELVRLVVIDGGLILAGAAGGIGKIDLAFPSLDVSKRIVGVAVLGHRVCFFAGGDGGECSIEGAFVVLESHLNWRGLAPFTPNFQV